jgi:hypothetical protein
VSEPKPESLLQLIYASAAAAEFPAGKLRTLLLRARNNNERLSISGMLLFHEGSFLQVLEGPAVHVQGLYAKIGQDPRHHRVIKLSEKWISEREFGDWQMGYVAVDTNVETQIRGFSNFFRWHTSETELPSDKSAERILHAFRAGRFRTHVEH